MNDVKLAWDTIIGDDDRGESQIVANATDAEAAMTWNDLFSISCSKLKCILQNQDLFDAVGAIANSEIMDPCNSEATTEEIIGAVLDNMEEDCNAEGFEEAMDGVDKINPTLNFINCDNLKCVYDYLNNNDFFSYCNNILIFDNSTHIDLTLDVGTTEWNAEGQVKMGSLGTGVVMTFAPYNCNETDHIKLAETILHESFHARFRYDLANNNMTESQYKDAFMTWVNEKYDQNFTEHELMIEFYMTEIATQLAILDGNKYVTSYYMAWVWDGLSSEWSGQLDTGLIGQWENKRNIVNANNPFKCD